MKYESQNDLLLHKLMIFYNADDNLNKMLCIINGESKISLRIVDWFSTNYAKKWFTVYDLDNCPRFRVYNDYKLKLKAYSKRRFDPFCRWERIKVPFGDQQYSIETTIGQLNFFKWAIENKIIDYIERNYVDIEFDMNSWVITEAWFCPAKRRRAMELVQRHVVLSAENPTISHKGFGKKGCE